MTSKYRTFAFFVIGMIILFQLTGCATREKNDVHPYMMGFMFQAPLINLDKYKSAHDRPENREDLAVAVAISGGGERAANFAIGVLLELENIPIDKPNGNALQEVDYFSTVSGGGMAVAAYYSALYSHVGVQGRTRSSFRFNNALRVSYDDLVDICKSENVAEHYNESFSDRTKYVTDPCLRRHLERGYHGNIVKALFNSKLNRSDALEYAFAMELAGERWNDSQLNLGQLFVPMSSYQKQQYPQWVTNSTVLENGNIFPFTPDILNEYRISGYVHKKELISKRDADDHFSFALEMPLSVGMTASGNFPSLINPRTLRSDHDQSEKRNGFIHLIDGGVSDNLGLFTALSILRQQKPTVKRKVLIVIDAYPGNFSPYSYNEDGPNFLTVYFKLPELPLDGLRGRSREYIKQVSESSGIDVFYLSFDELYRDDGTKRFIESESKVEQLFKEIENYYPTAVRNQPDLTITTLRKDNPKKKSPFQIARKVKTRYNITRAEQEFLIAVGRYLVAKYSDEIKAKLSGNRQ